MQDSNARKLTRLTTSKLVAVIGILLLSLTVYVVYIAIDAQASGGSSYHSLTSYFLTSTSISRATTWSGRK